MTEFMTIGAFCERFAVSRATLYREAAAGRLTIRKIGKAARIALADAEIWAANLPTLKSRRAALVAELAGFGGAR